MKIQIISDLHIEFLTCLQTEKIISTIQPNGDVLVLAGDIGNPNHPSYIHFLEQINKKFSKIFLITGNHEYYGDDVQNCNKKIQDLCLGLENVSFLSSSYEDYLGFRWIGTTLWSLVEPTTPFRINDVKKIRLFSIQEYNQLHQESVDFLNTTLAHSTTIPSIVITHHLPSHQLIHPKYKKPPHNHYNQWFASSLDPFIQQYTHQIPLWIYGHTHDFSHLQLYETQMVCNPLGYEEEHNNTNLNYVVELFTK